MYVRCAQIVLSCLLVLPYYENKYESRRILLLLLDGATCLCVCVCGQNDPERTNSVFRGDFYVTGDSARKDDDGYIWFAARTDDVINSSG